MKIAKLPAKMFHIGCIVEGDVRVVRVERGVILMIGLGSVERLQRDDLRHNRTRKRPGLIQLGDVCLRDVFLLITAVEDHRPVLAAGVWPWTIQAASGWGVTEKNTLRSCP